ncbi:MAG TPA: branched-chain amino acid ABC transporter permease, partial [Microthrixaceae bacterium]|nr:branched-chain amino acid ABC transporter permease [Microthrixaceae bacterium]
LAFALMFERMIRPLDWVSGGNVPVKVPRPSFGSVELTSNRSFLLFAAVLSAIASIVVILVRRGTTGRFLDAVRGSEVAAASIGITPSRQRLVAFVLSAGIAGFGGGLMASFVGEANYEANFVFLFGLVWLTLVVTAGARSVQAAIVSGITFFLVPKLLERLFAWPGNVLDSHPDVDGIARTLLEFPNPTWSQGVAFILFGFGALTYAKHPEGIIEYQTTASVNRIVARVERRKRPPDPEQPSRPSEPSHDLTPA